MPICCVAVALPSVEVDAPPPNWSPPSWPLPNCPLPNCPLPDWPLPDDPPQGEVPYDPPGIRGCAAAASVLTWAATAVPATTVLWATPKVAPTPMIAAAASAPATSAALRPRRWRGGGANGGYPVLGWFPGHGACGPSVVSIDVVLSGFKR
jgi:hypothetical protein